MSLKPITQNSTGFTLIEILVAALVLAIGILGMATMMLSSLKSDQSAFYRSLASSYAYDMADRIRTNASWARLNSGYDDISTENTIPNDPGCMDDADGCDGAALAALDIREWANNFTNVNGIDASQYKASLPNAVGIVTRGANDLFTITIQWSEVDWDANDPSQKADSTKALSLNVVL